MSSWKFPTGLYSVRAVGYYVPMDHHFMSLCSARALSV